MKNYADPFKVESLGYEGLRDFLAQYTHGNSDERLAQRIFNACLLAVELYRPLKEKGCLPFDYAQVQDEVNTEFRLMEYERLEIEALEKKMCALYKKIDPKGILRSLYGIGPVISAGIMGIVRDIDRFKKQESFKSYSGVTPKKRQSGIHEKKGLKITKAGNNLLKNHLYMAVTTAIRYDPEFASCYYGLKKRGKHHNAIMCALANKMAGRIYAVLKRMKRLEQNELPLIHARYHLRDLNGQVISPKEARELIGKRFRKKKGEGNISLESWQSLNSTQRVGDPLPLKDVIKKYHASVKMARATRQEIIYP